VSEKNNRVIRIPKALLKQGYWGEFLLFCSKNPGFTDQKVTVYYSLDRFYEISSSGKFDDPTRNSRIARSQLIFDFGNQRKFIKWWIYELCKGGNRSFNWNWRRTSQVSENGSRDGNRWKGLIKKPYTSWTHREYQILGIIEQIPCPIQSDQVITGITVFTISNPSIAVLPGQSVDVYNSIAVWIWLFWLCTKRARPPPPQGGEKKKN